MPSSRRTTTVLLLILLAALLGFPGAAQPAYAATPQPDLDYLNQAHQLNLTIIRAAQLAQTNGRSACVRKAGAQLERDHRRLSAQELAVADRLGLGLVAIPSLAERQQLDALTAKGKTAAFDNAWLVLQRQEHQQYLKLIGGDLPQAASPAVEAVANGAKPVVEMDLRIVAGPCRTASGTPVVPTGDGGQVAAAQQARSRTAVVLLGLGVLLLLVGKAISVRRRVLGVAALAVGLVLLFGKQPPDTGDVPKAGAAAEEGEAAVPPVRLKLPGVLTAAVQPVGTGGDGRLQLPGSAADVGWWAAGAAPGSAGGTVLLAGHVDTTRGRGVFAALPDVAVGARVAVTGGDGGVHWYRIVSRRTYEQNALPADLFSGAAKPRLALVTCTGSYDRATRRYSQNLVLYGVPLD
ncbi:DUF4142 domain-containing protein [Kribbella solani]|uniref:DUF4142 domain-containing protein n=1 Tax=Kribbella solani TaxID=236067 RepID=UPI0029A85094|nr:DUF4142 domain-containing protein [Kribbella solani]MDX2971069.1 DUF4142 domain-containing protein [Kribbella solani]